MIKATYNLMRTYCFIVVIAGVVLEVLHTEYIPTTRLDIFKEAIFFAFAIQLLAEFCGVSKTWLEKQQVKTKNELKKIEEEEKNV